MSYNLVRPCPKCPFRKDVPGYLRGARCVELARSIRGGAEFYCHQTTVEVDDDGDMGAGPDSQVCAGALGVMLNEEAPNQMARIAMRIGIWNPDKLDTSKAFDSFEDFVVHHAEADGAEKGEPCEVVGYNCSAPAGWMEGGEVVNNIVMAGATSACPECGSMVCPECEGECCDYS